MNEYAKQYYSSDEVSKMLGIHRNTLRQWVGRIDGVSPTTVGKTGKHLRYSREDIDKIREAVACAADKSALTTGGLSKMLGVPPHKLLYWEKRFPMFRPGRTPLGSRKYMQADVEMAKTIKHLLLDMCMKPADVEVRLRLLYGKRGAVACKSPEEAIALLAEAREALKGSLAAENIDAVLEFLRSAGNGGE